MAECVKVSSINNGCHEASVEAVGFEILSAVETYSQFASFILHLMGPVLYNHHLRHTHTHIHLISGWGCLKQLALGRC